MTPPTLLLASALWLAPQAASQTNSALPAAAASAPRAAPLASKDVAAQIAALASRFPALASRIAVGRSRGGTPIEALRLGSGTHGAGRPAVLVVSNVEGPYAWTGGLVLDLARELAEREANDAALREMLATTTLYFVACPNPDANDSRFASPLAERRAGSPFKDDDRDGRIGEDGPSDIDGDGLILTMRVPDPDGRWIADPNDPRALVEADALRGEIGKWKLFVEGRDSDGDEQVGEDPKLDVEVARNFPHGWKEHAAFSGPWPTSEPEAQALCEFVLTHRDVQMVVVYGALDTLVEPQKNTPDAPGGLLTNPPEADTKLYAEIGKRYKALTSSKAKSAGDDDGTFQAWCQLQRGLWCVSISPWTLPLDEAEKKKDGASEAPKEGEKPAEGDAKKPEGARDPSDDAKRLRWIDAKNESARFVAWRPFQHPELGAVEIGGFAPFALIEPPESERAAIADAQRAFLVELAGKLARVRISEVTAEDLGGVWKIKATIANDAFLPQSSAAARRTGETRPARVRIELPPGAKLVAGDVQTLVGDLGASGARRELQWLVTARDIGALRIAIDTDDAGTASAAPQVRTSASKTERK